MEPLTALGLASNVIQLIDFGARIVSKSSELYKSSNGRLIQHTDIATTCSDLERLTSKLSESILPHSVTTVLLEDELALYNLSHGCVDVSQQLQDGLNKLQIDGAPSRWKSLRKALKSIWKKERLAELQNRLVEYRDQLDSRILVGLKTNLDVVGLRQSEGFDRVDENIKAVVELLQHLPANLELKAERRAGITDTAVEYHVYRAQDTVVEAIEGSAKARQQEFQSVQADLTIVQTSNGQNLEETHNSRDEVIASLASSVAASGEDHERTRDELTRQWRSAEEQIVDLRKELQQIQGLIAASARKASVSKAKTGSEQQNQLIERTNLLYKILVAKDIMLQTLLELVEAIKKQLSLYTKVVTSVKWKVDPYRSTNLATHLSLLRPVDSKTPKPQIALFTAVEAGALSMMPELERLKSVVNNTGVVTISLDELEPQTALFYSTMAASTSETESTNRVKNAKYPQYDAIIEQLDETRQDRTAEIVNVQALETQSISAAFPDVVSNVRSPDTEQASVPNQSNASLGWHRRARSTPGTYGERMTSGSATAAFTGVPQAINIEMTALTWSLFTLRCRASDVRLAVLDVLIDAGANRQVRDRTGLCAYDHARILGLDYSTVEILNPFAHAPAGVSFGLLDAIRKQKPDLVLSWLPATRSNALDKMDQSPLALAAHELVFGVLGKLFKAGFSPFAGYVSETDYYPSIAAAYLTVCDRGLLDDFHYELIASFEDWARDKSGKISPDQSWLHIALDIQNRAVEGSDSTVKDTSWGDFLVLCALMGQTDRIRTCLERPWTLARLPADSLAWSLYAAIRCGNVDLILLLGRHCAMSTMFRPLDQRHFLAYWWPWPCCCVRAIHHLGSRTLFEYVESLGHAPVYPSCDWCDERAPQYQAIADNHLSQLLQSSLSSS